ncbi:MAG: transposon-encoded TnpW family protein [Clostridiales bacterium]|nr:transposon-encoded TnpW family protein [Clostridiales bacterium]
MNNLRNTTTTPGPFKLRRKIGSTTYVVGIHFDLKARESLDEKILRLLKNDLQSAPGNAKVEPLQAGWLPERGSL